MLTLLRPGAGWGGGGGGGKGGRVRKVPAQSLNVYDFGQFNQFPRNFVIFFKFIREHLFGDHVLTSMFTQL